MEKEVFIFDFDNTIVDSLDFWYDVMDEKTFLHFGFAPDSRIKKLRKGKSNDEIAKIFIELTKADISTRDVINFWNKSMEYNYLNKISLLVGVKEYLYKLKKQGKKLFIASATEKSILMVALKHFDIDIFEDIFTETNIGFAKHDNRFYETFLSKIGVKSNNVVLFEDSFVSLKSANSVGILCNAVLHKYNEVYLKEISQFCKYVIKDFKNINLDF